MKYSFASLLNLALSMDSSSSSIPPKFFHYWNYFNLLILRPIIAILFVLSFIILGWFLAWKLVLVHVPLIQEIFGLRKKPVKPTPTRLGRFSRFYNDEINSTNSYGDRKNSPGSPGDQTS